MGVIHKLRDDVVHFIISQRQGNPLFSCRQLAESASEKFGLRLSKSSVHDVLKESGIVTPRGRKPKDKFKIPQEKKKQIQASLSQVNLMPGIDSEFNSLPLEGGELIASHAPLSADSFSPIKGEEVMEVSPEYEGAGKIFLKAVLWDLGIYSQEPVKESDWDYYLTYTKGIKIFLENNKHLFIDLPLPIERCVREVADGLINNMRPLIVHKVSDEDVFKACMEAREGFKITNVSIVDQNYETMAEFSDVVACNKDFLFENRTFVESHEKNVIKRSNALFFPQIIDNKEFVEEILSIKGFDSTNTDKIVVNLIISDKYDKNMFQQAAEKINGMCLCDEQNRAVKVSYSS